MKLSIIIPHYNSPKLLENLLSTIPDKEEIQVIVVDDHSNKQLEKLEGCKKRYEGRNIEFYENPAECKNAGAARNTGLKYAKGEWLLFADADDYFESDFYEKIAPFFLEKYDIVYFIPTSIEVPSGNKSDRHVTIETYMRRFMNEPNLKNRLRLKYYFVEPWSKLIRKDLFLENEIMFDETEVANDVMCAVKLATVTDNIFVTDKQIYCVTKQEGTLTSKLTEERFDIRMSVFYYKHKYLKENLSKDKYRMVYFFARYRLRQASRFGVGKVFAVLRDMIKQGVPLWREYMPSYLIDAIKNYKIRCQL